MDSKELKLDIKPSVEHLDYVDTNGSNLKDDEISRDAQAATVHEHSMSVSDAIKYYKKSIFWAVVISLTIIMEGYDQILITSFFGYPTFQRNYGVQLENGDWEIPSNWMSALGSGASIGLVFGVMANGYLTERWGHRHVIMVSLIFMTGFIFMTFFAPNVQVLFAGQIMCGLPWGVFATMGPTYSSEVCPMALRGYLTAYVNMCWAIGQFIAAGVLQGLVSNDTQWGYRIPFAIQWAWPIPLFILTYFAPDSPWWLVRKGREEDAIKSVKRLTSKEIHHLALQRVAMIIHTNRLEREQTKSSNYKSGLKGFIECFKGTNLRRTEIACVAFAGQVTCGAAFAYSPSYFFRQAGLSADDTYKLNLGVTGIAFTGCVCSWFLLSKFGRRTIYVTGFGALCFCLLMIGILQKPAYSNSNVVWGQCVFTLLWVATYALSIGPLTFTIVSEISATRVRSQTVALARTTYHLLQLIASIVEPYLINPGNANLKGYTGFVWFATAFPQFLWAFFRLPETKDRTYEELDIIFEKRINARKFSQYKIDEQVQVLE